MPAVERERAANSSKSNASFWSNATTRPRASTSACVHMAKPFCRSWLTMTNVRPSRCRSMSSSNISTACGSRPEYGSSRNTTSGSWMSARAMERRCVMPRENVRTTSRRRCFSSTASNSSMTRDSGATTPYRRA